MITKIKHHFMLTNFSLFFVLMALTYGLGFGVNYWWLMLLFPALTLYFFGFVWWEKYNLVCGACGTVYWDKKNYHCGRCGRLLVFRKKERVKRGDEPKSETITIPTCSKGHEVTGYDKFCPKCGEQLKV